MRKISFLLFAVLMIVLLALFAINIEVIWFEIKGYQRVLNRTLLVFLLGLKTSFSSLVFAKLLALSVIYGFLHALGPGHGKAVIVTHLVSNNKKFKSAFYTSLVGSLTHVGVAIVLAFSFFYVFTGLGLFEKQSIGRYFSLFSGVFVILIGLVLFLSTLLKKFGMSFNSKKVRRDSVVGVAAGIVPCPVTMTVLLVSLRYSIPFIGLTAAFGIGTGMFIALCFISLFPVFFSQKVSRMSFLGGYFRKYIPIFQGIIFILIGVFLLPLS